MATHIFVLLFLLKIVGMNTQALHQLLDTTTTMFDHALQTFKEMRMLDAANAALESEEEQKQRRRLKALRWALIMSVVYGGYRLIRRLLRKRQPQLAMYPAAQPSYAPTTSRAIQAYPQNYPYAGAATSPYSSSYGGADPYSPYYSGGASSMYPGGGYGGSYF